MSIGKTLLAYVFVFVTTLSPSIANAQETPIEKYKRLKAETEEFSEDIKDARSLCEDGNLQDAARLLNDLERFDTSEALSAKAITVTVQLVRINLAHKFAERDQIPAALDQYRMIQSRYHSGIEDKTLRQSLALSFKSLSALLVRAEPKTEPERNEWTKNLGEAFDMIYESIDILRKFQSEANLVTKDSTYIAELLACRAELAKSIGEPKLAESRKEIELELQRLRGFHSVNPNREDGVLALAKMLDSARKGQEINSKQRLIWQLEKEKLLEQAIAKPDASVELARAYAYVLDSQGSRLFRFSDPPETVLKEMDAHTAKAVQLEQRFPGEFERRVKRSKESKTAYQKYLSERRR